MEQMVNVIMLACSLYLINAASRIKTTGEVTQTLLGKGLDMRRCMDPEGFRAFFFVRVLVLGITTLIYGMLGLFKNLSPILSILYFAWLFVMLIVLFWYMGQIKKGVKKYWGLKI